MTATATKRDHLWYRITHVRALNGAKAERRWEVTCRKCHLVHTFRPGGSNDDKIRRNLIREGWDIGHSTLQNTCPDCEHPTRDAATLIPAETQALSLPQTAGPRPQPEPEFVPQPQPGPTPEPEPEVPAKPFLIEAWEAATENERAELHAMMPIIERVVEVERIVEQPAEPLTLAEYWYNATETRRKEFLELFDVRWEFYDTVSIVEIWNHKARNERTRSECRDFLDQLRKEGVPFWKPTDTLSSIWNASNDTDRKMFFSWLQTTGLLPKPLTLIEMWERAAKPEREKLIALVKIDTTVAQLLQAKEAIKQPPAPATTPIPVKVTPPSNDVQPDRILLFTDLVQMGVLHDYNALYRLKRTKEFPAGDYDLSGRLCWRTSVIEAWQAKQYKPRPKPVETQPAANGDDTFTPSWSDAELESMSQKLFGTD